MKKAAFLFVLLLITLLFTGCFLVLNVDNPSDNHTHVPEEAVMENEIFSTCTEAGSYDKVIYCSVCKKEISREEIVTPALGHSPANAVQENIIASTCTSEGSYDQVTYCRICKTELSRNKIVTPALGHTPAKAVRENGIAPTCTSEGSYEEVIRCSVCKIELSRKTKSIPVSQHTWSEWNVQKEATCTESGERSRTCSVCQKIENEVVSAPGHSPKSAVKENEVASTAAEPEHYDLVVRCSRCNEIISSTQITAYSEGLSFFLDDDGNCSVHWIGTCKDAFLHIPPVSPDGKSVTSIGWHAFDCCTGLISVTIPSSVTSIGDGAFYHCTGLTSVTIPDSVTSIGEGAFSDCSGLRSITIPASVTSIGTNPFIGCSSLKSIISNSPDYPIIQNCLIEAKSKTLIAGCKNSVIPDDGSVTSIGDYAFYNCSSLTSVIIPDSVTSIGNYAFEYCSALTSVTIPDSVTSIGNYAFEYCSRLTSVTIPDSVTSIGDSAFEYCSALTSVTIPNSVTSIGRGAFSHCPDTIFEIVGGTKYIGKWAIVASNTSITRVTLQDGTVGIAGSAFSGCSKLTDVTIPDSVTSIGGGAFYYCTGLTSVTIPASVTSIGTNPFSECSSLESIVSNSPDYPVIENCLMEAKSKTLITGCKNSMIPDDGSVTSIGDYAFSNCSGLTSIVIPNSVTSIGSGAFWNCSGLIDVTIPDSVTSIGSYAFYGCSRLISIEYQGTIKQWNSISKSSSGNSNIGDYIIVCTDGVISKGN